MSPQCPRTARNNYVHNYEQLFVPLLRSLYSSTSNIQSVPYHSLFENMKTIIEPHPERRPRAWKQDYSLTLVRRQPLHLVTKANLLAATQTIPTTTPRTPPHLLDPTTFVLRNNTQAATIEHATIVNIYQEPSALPFRTAIAPSPSKKTPHPIHNIKKQHHSQSASSTRSARAPASCYTW